MESKGKGPVDVKRIANDIDANVRGLLALPSVVTSLQQLGEVAPAIERIAGFEATLSEIAGVVPALGQLAELGTTLDAIAQVVPVLERLALVGDVLAELASVIEPLSALSTLVPTLESLDRSISELQVTIGNVSDTLSPLQSTTERMGKVVDRLANRRSKNSRA
jgi:hypothetical protein